MLALSAPTVLALVGWACSLVVEVQVSWGLEVSIPFVVVPRLSWAQGRRTMAGRPEQALLVLGLLFASHHPLVVHPVLILGGLVQL